MNRGDERRTMVERQLQARGIRDRRVLDAMLLLAREDFIPEPYRAEAYSDQPLPIGLGQTISQPYITALMAECLELSGDENVLEVGAGCGYHAALLAMLSARVTTIELIPELGAMARRNIESAGFAEKVTVIEGNGSLGWPPEAPYDAISIAAAADEIPAALLAQLKDSGRMVAPVGPESEQELQVLWKERGTIRTRVAAFCRFVPLL